MNPAGRASGTTGALAGRAILVTRPAAQAAGLCRRIAAAGGEPVPFPALEILSIPNALQGLHWLGEDNVIKPGIPQPGPDWLVFISPTAVAEGLACLPAAWLAGARLAAVGAATGAALQARLQRPVLCPTGRSDSEALAALPEFQQLAGQSVLIVRGAGGREWLAQTLQARGARVGSLACYRRVRPQADPAALLARWQTGGIHAVTITSGEALANLAAMLGAPGHGPLRDTPLFTVHERIAGQARALGVHTVQVTGAGDAAMVAGMEHFFATVA